MLTEEDINKNILLLDKRIKDLEEKRDKYMKIYDLRIRNKDIEKYLIDNDRIIQEMEEEIKNKVEVE